MIREFRSRQFVMFLVTGGCAAAVNFGSRIVYNRWTSFSWAVVLAYATGMITAYLLARTFVFRNTRQTIHRSMVFFVLVNALAALQTWSISVGLAYYVLPSLGIKTFVREIAHGVGVTAPVFSSYIGHKYWSFRA